MRELLPLLLLTVACATTTAKRTVEDIEIDVLWAEEAPPAAAGAQEKGPESPLARPSVAHKTKRSAAQPSKKPQAPALHTSSYHLSYQGKRIGEAREYFHRSETGVRVIRHEEIRVMRAGVPVESETEIVIHADSMLHANRVDLSARAGAVTRKGQALRAKNGSWLISLEGEPTRSAPADAVPLELVPYILARNGSHNFRSRVLLAGYGFALTQMKVDHEGRRGTAVLETEWGDIETELKLAGNGTLLRAATGSTSSTRVGAERLGESFTPPELLSMSTIPVTGEGTTLLVENASRRPPPALGGQSVALGKKGWRVHFDSEPAQVSPRVAALTRQVDSLLSDSHDAPGAGAGDARELGRGDCTAHATLFVELASEQGLEAKLVTGFRINEDKLVRHRWVAVRQGMRWVQVDPTFGEAPVQPGQHLALAVHGSSTAQIALVDEAVFRGLGRASARWIRSSLAGR